METRGQKARTAAAYVIIIAAVVAAAGVFFKYLAGICIPFLLAWGLALAVRPIAARIGRRTRIPNRILRLGILILLYAALVAGLWIGGARLLRELSRLFTRLTEEGTASAMLARVHAFLDKLPFLAPGAEGYAEHIFNEVISQLAGYLPVLLGVLLSSVPRAAVTAVVVLIASVYFCLDLERIHATIISCMPPRMAAFARRCRGGAARIAATYVKAYLLLMLLTAALLFVGFLIIGVEYALLLAFVVSLVDLFPVLGVGTVLVPWSIWCALTGAPGRALALLALWGVALLVRQVAEPRILGGSLGVHPLLTLVAMYAGLHLGGVLGMLVAPALIVPVAGLLRRGRDGGENPA